MKAVGGFVTVSGWVVFAVTGLWGFFSCLGIISKAVGFWGLIVALFLSPITFFAAPIYAGFVWGNWFPLMLNYGGGITAVLLIGIGSHLSNR